MIVWIQAQTSGKWHVPGKHVRRRATSDGLQLLCGWVIQDFSPQAKTDPPKEARCTACARLSSV